VNRSISDQTKQTEKVGKSRGMEDERGRWIGEMAYLYFQDFGREDPFEDELSDTVAGLDWRWPPLFEGRT
jgi:hypothetical protein